ncbi:SUKH-4 family immunity protein [Streptomyces sp. NPDC047130]|uniref:SUKH-4 family immunity protein n=1 Tax=Streptomyces sp. NPDC047130 TaxID=3155261 RepID=UPI0034055C34
MVTYAQAQERGEEWINGDAPAYQHREVRVREFELGFVVWAEDRADGPRSDGGAQRLVVARDSGEATLWPGLPVGEVIRRYEELYGRQEATPTPPPAPARVDLNQTSFLLSPPEWLQEAADRMGIPDQRGGSRGGGTAQPSAPATPAPAPTPAPVPAPAPAAPAPATAGGTPWDGTDTTAQADGDRSVPLPETVFAPPTADAPPGTPGAPDAQTALMQGGSQLPPTRVTPARPEQPAPRPPQAGPGVPARPASPDAGDIADAATAKAAPPRRPATGSTPPPPPPPPPGPRSASAPAAPPSGGDSLGYVPTQMVSSLGPQGPGTPEAPGAPGAPGGSQGGPGGPGGGDVHHALTMLADPSSGGAAPPPPPGPPGAPGGPGAPGTPPPPPPAAPGGVHHAETVFAPPSGPPVQPAAPGPVPPAPVPPPPPAPGAPGMPPAYGYPQQPQQPMVGPGYQAVLRYRAPDGSEHQLIRRSAPGLPHPEWQIFHELRAMNVPQNQVLELHTELESCSLPGAYCSRMIREQWPQARITSIAPYGEDHTSRQQGMAQLLAHQGELHQVADGPARPGPVRAPLPPVQPLPPVPPEGVAHELAAVFGPGVFRFDQAAVSRQGVPPVVAHTLVVAGLPYDLGPFFWAQAQPGRPVPTLAELAQERGVQPAPDAGSYLVMGTDFGKAVCVQYGTAHIVAVPVEAGPGGAPVPPQFVNTGLPEFARCLALLGRMWPLRFGLNQEQAARWTVDFQAQLAALDAAALGSPETWWSVLLEQFWDGLL